MGCSNDWVVWRSNETTHSARPKGEYCPSPPACGGTLSLKGRGWQNHISKGERTIDRVATTPITSPRSR